MAKEAVSRSRVFLSGIFGGVVSLTLSNFAVKVLGLIYKIPLAHFLGDSGMGYFNSAYTVFGLFYLLCTAGVPKAIMIICAEMGEKEEAAINNVIKVSMRAFLLIGILLMVALLLFASPIAAFIGNEKSAFTIIAIAPSIVFVAIGGVLRDI